MPLPKPLFGTGDKDRKGDDACLKTGILQPESRSRSRIHAPSMIHKWDNRRCHRLLARVHAQSSATMRIPVKSERGANMIIPQTAARTHTLFRRGELSRHSRDNSSCRLYRFLAPSSRREIKQCEMSVVEPPNWTDPLWNDARFCLHSTHITESLTDHLQHS